MRLCLLAKYRAVIVFLSVLVLTRMGRLKHTLVMHQPHQHPECNVICIYDSKRGRY